MRARAALRNWQLAVTDAHLRCDGRRGRCLRRPAAMCARARAALRNWQLAVADAHLRCDGGGGGARGRRHVRRLVVLEVVLRFAFYLAFG